MRTPIRLMLLLACGVVMFIGASACAQEDSSQTPSKTESSKPQVLNRWALGGAFSILTVKYEELNDEGLRGPSVHVARVNPDGIGVDFGITYILPVGFYDFKGLSADAALSYGFGLNPRTVFQLKGGATGFVGGNSDGGGGGDFALYPAVGIVLQLGGQLAVAAELSERFWFGYGGSQSPGARLGLLVTL